MLHSHSLAARRLRTERALRLGYVQANSPTKSSTLTPRADATSDSLEGALVALDEKVSRILLKLEHQDSILQKLVCRLPLSQSVACQPPLGYLSTVLSLDEASQVEKFVIQLTSEHASLTAPQGPRVGDDFVDDASLFATPPASLDSGASPTKDDSDRRNNRPERFNNSQKYGIFTPPMTPRKQIDLPPIPAFPFCSGSPNNIPQSRVEVDRNTTCPSPCVDEPLGANAISAQPLESVAISDTSFSGAAMSDTSFIADLDYEWETFPLPSVDESLGAGFVSSQPQGSVADGAVNSNEEVMVNVQICDSRTCLQQCDSFPKLPPADDEFAAHDGDNKCTKSNDLKDSALDPRLAFPADSSTGNCDASDSKALNNSRTSESGNFASNATDCSSQLDLIGGMDDAISRAKFSRMDSLNTVESKTAALGFELCNVTSIFTVASRLAQSSSHCIAIQSLVDEGYLKLKPSALNMEVATFETSGSIPNCLTHLSHDSETDSTSCDLSIQCSIAATLAEPFPKPSPKVKAKPRRVRSLDK